MKKILFCASLLAIAASCSDNEYESLSKQNEEAGKGIVFDAGLAEIAKTRGEFEYDTEKNFYDFFWYAEKDRINIYSANTKLYGAVVSPIKTDINSWSFASPVEYKATQSKSGGQFTGISDGNIVEFWGATDLENLKANLSGESEADKTKLLAQAKLAQFVAVYPKTTTVSNFEKDNAGKLETFKLDGLSSIATQNQTGYGGQGSIDKMVMYSYSEATQEKAFEAVGEKINLKFIRPFGGITYSTLGVDKYSKVFGPLETITLESKGSGTGANAVAPFVLDYGTGATVLVDRKDATKNEITNGGTTSSKITLNLGEGGVGLEWADDKMAYMAVNRVEREGKEDNLEVIFKFKNITLPVEGVSTKADWPSKAGNNALNQMTKLDISKFPYLVTGDPNAAENGRTLIVNSGSFNDIFGTDGKVVWPLDKEATVGQRALSEFTTIIANVNLTTSELQKLNTFVNVRNLELAKNNSIAKGMVDALQLDSIVMPEVESIAKDAFKVSATNKLLYKVILPKYKFNDDEINAQILTDKLVKLDMSAVTEMNVGFPARGLSLANRGELKEVTIGDGLKVGASAFNNCPKLEKINGKIVLLPEAAGAFEKCAKLATLEMIDSRVIPAAAFKGCTSLKDIKNNGAQVKPTKVDYQGFMSCSAIEVMDLSETTEVGKQAFHGCAKLTGTTIDGKKVLKVGAAKISEGAFGNCTSLIYVYFRNATIIENEILFGCVAPTLKEVKFGEVFNIATSATAKTYNALTFGNTSVKLFVRGSQETIEGKTLELVNNKATGSFEFQSINREDTNY